MRFGRLTFTALATLFMTTSVAAVASAHHAADHWVQTAWDFDDGSGTRVYDSATGRYTGELIGSHDGSGPPPAWGAPGAVGPSMLVFNRANAVLGNSFMNGFPVSSYSYEFYLAMPPAGEFAILIGRDAGTCDVSGTVVFFDDAGLVLWHMSDKAVLGAFPTDGTFHHVVVTYDGATGDVGYYVDGVGGIVGALPAGGPPPFGGNLIVGNFSGPPCYPGPVGSFAMDNIVAWRVALDADEVSTRYAATSSGAGAPYPVPELSSILLVGTGILGLGAIALRRRDA